MINPGAGPVSSATLEQAEANMRVFVGEVAGQATREGETRGYEPQVGEAVRAPEADGEGRFGWVLRVNGAQVRVRMPGVALAEVRGAGVQAPCLIVGEEPLWWPSAVTAAVPLPGR